MYMAVRKQANTQRSVVDVSRYTGMEIEHAHNTAGLIVQKHGTHLDAKVVDDFVGDMRK